ncbi:MAG: hypothetical protein ACJ8J0_19910 [Longimicrobiaceae bacterium]
MSTHRFRRPPLLRALLLAALASACGGDGPTGGGGKKVYDVGQVVTGTLANATEVQTIRVRSNAAGDAAVFLQGTAGAVQASLTTEAGAVLATVTAATAGHEEPSGVVHLDAGTVYRLLVSAASGSAGGGYRVRVDSVGAAPERVPAAVPVDEVIEGERLESPADVDDFTFTGAAGEVYIAFLQAGPGGGALYASVPHPTFTGALVAQVASNGGDAALETQSTGRFELPASGTYHLKVSALSGAAPSLADYRLQLRRVRMGPESRPAALPANDTTTGEAIDYVGDIDEFTLSGTPGELYNVFFAADPATLRGGLTLEVQGSGNLRRLGSDGQQVLLRNSTGSVSIPASGSVTVRVIGNSDHEVNRGGYRIFAYRVDPAPEHAAPVLALNDSVVGERIDLPGDVDVYTLDLAREATVVLSIGLQGPDGPGGGRAYLVENPNLSSYTVGDGGNAGSIPTTLAAGRYHVRVDAPFPEEGVGFRTGYRLRAYASEPTPEHVSPQVSVGETVTGEDLGPPGDMDRFTFQATAGQELNFFLQGTGGSANAGMYAIVSSANDGFIRSVWSTFDTPTLRTRGTRFTVPATGTYSITMFQNNGGSFADVGAYRFALLPATRAPEHVPATVAVGSTVTGESLDYPSDVDNFTVTAAPGTTLTMALGTSMTAPAVNLEAVNPATGLLIGWYSVGGGTPQTTFTVPAGGTVRLVVTENWYCEVSGNGCDFGATGAYTLTVQQAP